MGLGAFQELHLHQASSRSDEWAKHLKQRHKPLYVEAGRKTNSLLIFLCVRTKGMAATAGTLGGARNCRQRVTAYTCHEGLQDWQALGF